MVMVLWKWGKGILRKAVGSNANPPLYGWQRNYYDRIIRNDAELERIRGYIFNNSSRWDEDSGNLMNRRVVMTM